VCLIHWCSPQVVCVGWVVMVASTDCISTSNNNNNEHISHRSTFLIREWSRDCITLSQPSLSAPLRLWWMVFGGMDKYISSISGRKQPMRSDTNLLEFGNYIIVIVGAHSHTLN